MYFLRFFFQYMITNFLSPTLIIIYIRIITDVLIDHVSDDEKIRIDRKAVKLVKLAILPSDVRIFLIQHSFFC